ncbi:MAG: hypothetical protein AAGI38_01005 [Bacteroidota bacterium]
MRKLIYPLFSLLLLWAACSTDAGEEVLVPDNDAPDYGGIPTILVENYVNRLYIDLLGREPVDAEMAQVVEELRTGELQKASREALVDRLMTSSDFVEGDSSYKRAYYLRIYELSKARLLEGVSDAGIRREIGIIRADQIKDSLNGNMAAYQQRQIRIDRMRAVIDSRLEYQNGQIPINDMYGRMLQNDIYDEINMNSINFIRSCFNDLFFRFHTQAEFDNSFEIIEYNNSSTIFGQAAQNKEEYVRILVYSREFYEGMIRWAYQTLLAREPSSAETRTMMEHFFTERNFQRVQKEILVTDEYANF